MAVYIGDNHWDCSECGCSWTSAIAADNCGHSNPGVIYTDMRIRTEDNWEKRIGDTNGK